jgi:hypothetical protein
VSTGVPRSRSRARGGPAVLVDDRVAATRDTQCASRS